eukprot:GAHX01002819.1.p1 GENE.GAHX01002819.1~~GAHX01002819.1.p1  ORF type:complete len:400 (-),score=79.07 GAHX01002819.1:136-1335(-)
MAQNTKNSTSNEVTLYNEEYISQSFTFIEYETKMYKDDDTAFCLDSLSKNNSFSTIISQPLPADKAEDSHDTSNSSCSFYHSCTVQTPLKQTPIQNQTASNKDPLSKEEAQQNNNYIVNQKNPFIENNFVNNEVKITLTDSNQILNNSNVQHELMITWTETFSSNTFLVDIMFLKNEESISSSYYILSTFEINQYQNYRKLKVKFDTNPKIEKLNDYMTIQFNNDEVCCIYSLSERLETSINLLTFLDSNLLYTYKLKLLFDYYQILFSIYNSKFSGTNIELCDFKYNSVKKTLQFISYNKLIYDENNIDKEEITSAVLMPLKYIEHTISSTLKEQFNANNNLECLENIIDKLNIELNNNGTKKEIENGLDEFYCNISRDNESSSLLDTQCLSKSLYMN